MFTLPTSTLPDIITSTSAVFNAFWFFIMLAITIPLAFLVITYVVSLFSKPEDHWYKETIDENGDVIEEDTYDPFDIWRV